MASVSSVVMTTRHLGPHDLDAVADIDAAITGRSRRAYFERRLLGALREPSLHLQFALEEDGALAGYVLARRLHGEFGRTEASLRLEVIGVAPRRQGKGLGSQLLGLIESEARQLNILELRTQAGWRDIRMLRFLDRAGFELGRNHVIDCAVEYGRRAAAEHGRRANDAGFGGEIDYGWTRPKDFENLARDSVDVRSLTMEDVPGAARLDSRITGRDRTAYIARKVEEALRDSAIRVSLAVHCDGSVAGYLTAKVDLGDFGRTEPVAVIDTIAVDPGYADCGFGTALVSQLFVNLEALRVERVETVVEQDQLDALAFFHKMGFSPSQRLGFIKRLES